MSMIICWDCDAPVDSDDDPGCFVEIGKMRQRPQTMILCENCRGRREDELQHEMENAS